MVPDAAAGAAAGGDGQDGDKHDLGSVLCLTLPLALLLVVMANIMAGCL